MKSFFPIAILSALLLARPAIISAQKVGVVLSGGGAAASAHVGFLKALEENEIPIDYIAGTSMGAIIAGLYASGWSPERIEAYMLSDEFNKSMTGTLDNKFKFFFKVRDQNSSWFNFRFNTDTWIQSSLPTNLIDPQLQDFRAMEVFSVSAARAGYDFDSLFIPYRCVASDIEMKRSVVFRSGNLNQAIRASATYPFYVPPIEVDGRLLFDGGIYNNFPSDVLYNDFLPDVILGSNVSDNADAPDKDDLISQLKSMILNKTNFDQVCERMIIVQPESRIGTFDFGRVGEMMQLGYTTTLDRMGEISSEVERRITKEEISAKRAAFTQGFKPLVFDEITFSGLMTSQKQYVRKVFGKADTVSVENISKRYFRAFNDDKINYILPTAIYKPQSGFYNLHLDINPEKDVLLEVGGVVSSRPVNTGYFGLRYNLMHGIAATLSANSYFGKLYGSVMVAPRFDFPSGYPIAVEPHFVINRWDYFKSLATFFEDVRPSFVVKKETYGGLHLIQPAGNRGKVVWDGRKVRLQDEYYQTPEFTNADTSDRTVFDGFTVGGVYERNTLNRKQYASDGTYLRISGRYVNGEERTLPGSTVVLKDTLYAFHDWAVARAKYMNYFTGNGRVKLGFALEGAASTQPFFNNFIATTIQAPAFNPIPEANAFFMPQFRAHVWASGGLMAVGKITKNLEMRAEGYVFLPFGSLETNELSQARFDYSGEQLFIGSGCVVFHSPVGPAAFMVNYYDQKDDPWSIIFTFGYVLFNRNALD